MIKPFFAKWREKYRFRDEAHNPQQWITLRIFNGYRLLLSLVMLVLLLTGMMDQSSLESQREMALSILVIYALVNVLSFACAFTRLFNLRKQTVSVVLFDIIVFTLLMYSSGGINYGFGILINASIAAGSILVTGRISLFFAAFAGFAVLGQHAFVHPKDFFTATAYAQSGILGATFFATAILAIGLSRRLSVSEALVTERTMDVEKLEKLNEIIIQRMRSGIIVCDETESVRFMNQAAWLLLGVPFRGSISEIADLSPELTQQMRAWQKNNKLKHKPFQTALNSHGLLLEYTRLDILPPDKFVILIFLEDSARLSQQAQQMKLASLGRLTASIAHEIRNPLGAISHAGQLLAEKEAPTKQETRLIEIIRTQSERMNNVIENVLQLSRRKDAAPKLFELKTYLEELIQQCRLQHKEDCEINLIVINNDIELFFDISQLNQVIVNLIDNGLQYSKEHIGHAVVDVTMGITPNTDEPYLEVTDYGVGVSADNENLIFEPFFTTKNHGTGLGLYIAKELCEANQASLTYQRSITSTGSCFRISFHHPGTLPNLSEQKP